MSDSLPGLSSSGLGLRDDDDDDDLTYDPPAIHALPLPIHARASFSSSLGERNRAPSISVMGKGSKRQPTATPGEEGEEDTAAARRKRVKLGSFFYSILHPLTLSSVFLPSANKPPPSTTSA